MFAAIPKLADSIHNTYPVRKPGFGEADNSPPVRFSAGNSLGAVCADAAERQQRDGPRIVLYDAGGAGMWGIRPDVVLHELQQPAIGRIQKHESHGRHSCTICAIQSERRQALRWASKRPNITARLQQEPPVDEEVHLKCLHRLDPASTSTSPSASASASAPDQAGSGSDGADAEAAAERVSMKVVRSVRQLAASDKASTFSLGALPASGRNGREDHVHRDAGTKRLTARELFLYARRFGHLDGPSQARIPSTPIMGTSWRGVGQAAPVVAPDSGMDISTTESSAAGAVGSAAGTDMGGGPSSGTNKRKRAGGLPLRGAVQRQRTEHSIAQQLEASRRYRPSAAGGLTGSSLLTGCVDRQLIEREPVIPITELPGHPSAVLLPVHEAIVTRIMQTDGLLRRKFLSLAAGRD